ncbi:hypothetical protein T4D_14524 [Trichinella pseudospiralis]|uniref:Uncharacterized protein n=1 Tax=Trichinella pseudospiralis TaxID=6337 RepID=A0A0V1FIH4_TRIPS|nr:hypothetical protein T4D_14524 [Trichinella pseudospiralis]
MDKKNSSKFGNMHMLSSTVFFPLPLLLILVLIVRLHIANGVCVLLCYFENASLLLVDSCNHLDYSLFVHTNNSNYFTFVTVIYIWGKRIIGRSCTKFAILTISHKLWMLVVCLLFAVLQLYQREFVINRLVEPETDWVVPTDCRQ